MKATKNIKEDWNQEQQPTNSLTNANFFKEIPELSQYYKTPSKKHWEALALSNPQKA